MEELLLLVFSEQGAIMGLFILTLYGVYSLAKTFLNKYLALQEEHNQHFLDRFDSMITKISTGDQAHSEEHKSIMNFLEDKHANNNAEHRDIIKLVGQIDGNVQKNTYNIEILSKEIKLHHSK